MHLALNKSKEVPMTYEEALIKIKPLKNKKGEYEFWITLQDGFLLQRRRKTVIDALRMSLLSSMEQGYLITLSNVLICKTAGDYMPERPESSQNEDADRWASSFRSDA